MWKNILEPDNPQMTNMALAHCMLCIYGYRHTLRICNTESSSTATVVTRTRLDVTLYALCLSCYLCKNLGKKRNFVKAAFLHNVAAVRKISLLFGLLAIKIIEIRRVKILADIVYIYIHTHTYILTYIHI